jgi:hypothetical protein
MLTNVCEKGTITQERLSESNATFQSCDSVLGSRSLRESPELRTGESGTTSTSNDVVVEGGTEECSGA